MAHRDIFWVIEEYNLPILAHEARAFDRLIEGRIPRFQEAVDVLQRFDRVVGRLFINCWTDQFRRFPEFQQRHYNRLFEQNCPRPGFWETSIMARLAEPQMVRAYLDYHFAMVREFDDDMEPGIHFFLGDIQALWEMAYEHVQHMMFSRLQDEE